MVEGGREKDYWRNPAPPLTYVAHFANINIRSLGEKLYDVDMAVHRSFVWPVFDESCECGAGIKGERL